MIEDCLRSTIARVLRTSPASVDVNRQLNEIGLDSLMAVELMHRLESETGVSVPPGRLTTSDSITRLTDILLELITGESVDGPGLTPAATPEDEEADQFLASLDEFSEDAVDAVVDELFVDVDATDSLTD